MTNRKFLKSFSASNSASLSNVSLSADNFPISLVDFARKRLSKPLAKGAFWEIQPRDRLPYAARTMSAKPFNFSPKTFTFIIARAKIPC
jgi:hypothetical protein